MMKLWKMWDGLDLNSKIMHSLLIFMFFFLPSFVSALTIIFVSQSWEQAYPIRPIEVPAYVARWDDGTRVLVAHYPAITSRRCMSVAEHWLERQISGEPIERFPLASVNNGGAPVSEHGLVVPVPFDLTFVLPNGFPAGVWYYTSSQATICEVLPGIIRAGSPIWTKPTLVAIPPVVHLPGQKS